MKGDQKKWLILLRATALSLLHSTGSPATEGDKASVAESRSDLKRVISSDGEGREE